MKQSPFSSLRSRLFVLVLVAVIPALGLILVTAAEQRQLAEADVKANALRLARLVAADQERLADEAWQLLTTLSHLPDLRLSNSNQSSDTCNQLLAELMKQYPQYVNIGVANPAGEVRCSAFGDQPSENLASQDFFQRALNSNGLIVSNYMKNPLTRKAVITFAYALRENNNAVQSVYFAALDLGWLNQLVTESQLPDGAVLIEIDRNGTVIMHYPDSQDWVGKSVSGTSLTQLMLAEGEGTADLNEPDDMNRLYAFTPLHITPENNMFVAIGVSKEAAFSEANRILLRHLIGLWVVFLLALAAAWLGGEVFILRRVRALLGATKRLQAGDLGARTGLPYGQGELSQLAQAFDQMTATLEQREQERIIAENETRRHYRDLSTLNRAITAISSSLELPEIIDALKRQLTGSLDVPGGILFFYYEESDSLCLEAAWGLPSAVLAELKELPASTYHYLQVTQAGEACLESDFRTVPPYSNSGLAAARPNWQGYLCVPLLAKGEILGVIDLFSAAPTAFSQDQITLFTTLGQQVGVVIQNARLFSQVRTGRQRLHILSQELLEVQERERRHISRELHDEVGQSLTALKVNLQAVLRMAGASTISRYIEESISIVQHILQQVRDLSLDLRPSLLDDLGVVAALRWYIDRQGLRAGFKTEFIADPPEMRLPPELETVCFRVVQEAMTNVVRHAVASQVQVRMTYQSAQLELIVQDDGIGFNVAAIRERTSGDASLGLLGMQERVQLVGGQIEFISDPERGTIIRAVFPLPVTQVHERYM